MATKNTDKNPNLSEQPPAVQSQAQSASAEPKHKRENAPDKQDETQFFDTTIAKIKTVEREDGSSEDVTVMSDHLDPGEELKTAYDARKAEEKLKNRQKADDEQSK